MAAVLLRPHDRDAPHDAPARLVAVKEKGGEPLRRASSEVRAIRMKCSATPAPVMNHLWPWITHPSPFFSARVSIMAGIGAAAGRRLGHDEGRAHRARRRSGCSQRSFCAGVPILLEQVHVAVVGRRAVERHRAEDRAVRLLVHRRPADDRQCHAAVLLRRSAAPTAPRPWPWPAPRAARRGGCSRDRRSWRGSASSGSTCSSTKRARAQADVLDLGRKREVHGLSLSTLACSFGLQLCLAALSATLSCDLRFDVAAQHWRAHIVTSPGMPGRVVR